MKEVNTMKNKKGSTIVWAVMLIMVRLYEIT